MTFDRFLRKSVPFFMEIPGQRFTILFLCTWNAGRSIFAEYFMRNLGSDRFDSFSARGKPMMVRSLSKHSRSLNQPIFGLPSRMRYQSAAFNNLTSPSFRDRLRTN